MANFIGRLGVLLGLDSAEFTRGLERAGKQLDNFVEKARTTSVAGAAAFTAMTYKAMTYADQLADTAKANDVAIDSVLKLSNALANSGGEAENAGRFLSSFTATVDKAAEGSFEVQKSFKSIGVSLGDLSRMGVDELFRKSVEGLANMSDPLTRNAKAMELFGKAAKGVDFVALNDEIQRGAGITDQQSQAVSDMADSFDMLAQAGRNFSLMLATELGPPLKTTLEYIKEIKGDTSLVGAAFRTAFETVVVLGNRVYLTFESIAREIGHTIDNAKLLAKLDFKGAIALNEAYAAENERRAQKLEEFERRMLGGGGGYGGGASSFDDPRRLDRSASSSTSRAVKPGIDKEAELLKKKQLDLMLKGFAEEERQREENRKLMAEQETMYQKGMASQMERVRLADIQLDREKAMMELAFQGRNMRGEELQYQQELLEIEYRRRDNIEKINADEKLDREGREYALRRENELAAKAVELAKQRLELTQQTRGGSLTEGFFDAMQRAARSAATEFERGQQAFESMVGNMENALTNFVRTGKLSFKDLARSIIQDMIAIQLRAQMLGLVNMLFRSISPFAVGGVRGPDNIDVGGGWNPASANGGPVEGGKIGLVGERGPELFVPRTSGTIIPNHQLAGMLGGGGVTYNGPYIANMSAIDTQSGIQFLAKNKQAVWAANQSAQRSMPVSR